MKDDSSGTPGASPPEAETPWALAQRLAVEGLSAAAIRERLLLTGLPPDDATVLLRALHLKSLPGPGDARAPSSAPTQDTGSGVLEGMAKVGAGAATALLSRRKEGSGKQIVDGLLQMTTRFMQEDLGDTRVAPAPPVAAPAKAVPSEAKDLSPRCQMHPQFPAKGTCSRCGTLVCHKCAANKRFGTKLCAACERQPVVQETRVKNATRLLAAMVSAEALLIVALLFVAPILDDSEGAWRLPLPYALALSLPFVVLSIVQGFVRHPWPAWVGVVCSVGVMLAGVFSSSQVEPQWSFLLLLLVPMLAMIYASDRLDTRRRKWRALLRMKPGVPLPEPAPPEPTTVPPGHRAQLFSVPRGRAPALIRTDEGVWIASLGHGGDEPVEELEDLLRELEPQLGGSRPPVRFSHAGRLEELFAPADPAVRSSPGLLLWSIDTPSLAAWMADPGLLQTLLRRIHRLGALVPPQSQYVYLDRHSSPAPAVMARLLAGLGLQVFERDPKRLLLAEVRRPDGTVISGLLGSPFALGDAAVDRYPATVNEEKAHAEAQGDKPRLLQLEQEERVYLAKLLEPVTPRLRNMPLGRALRLGRLLHAAVNEASPGAEQALRAELLDRTQPLLLLKTPDGAAVTTKLPSGGIALTAFPDLLSLEQAARKRNLREGEYGIAEISPHGLFLRGAQRNLSVTLEFLVDRHTSTHLWAPAAVRELAES